MALLTAAGQALFDRLFRDYSREQDVTLGRHRKDSPSDLPKELDTAKQPAADRGNHMAKDAMYNHLSADHHVTVTAGAELRTLNSLHAWAHKQNVGHTSTPLHFVRPVEAPTRITTDMTLVDIINASVRGGFTVTGTEYWKMSDKPLLWSHDRSLFRGATLELPKPPMITLHTVDPSGAVATSGAIGIGGITGYARREEIGRASCRERV